MKQVEIEDRKLPSIGFGTYPLTGNSCYQAVQTAIKTGYQIIDTATFYNNYDAVGKAIAENRDELYLISKVWTDSQTAEKLEADLKNCLHAMKIDSLDCYLIHWPNSSVPIEETLGQMQALQKQGLVKHLGISNPSKNHLKRAQEVGVSINWVQFEMHPEFCDFDVLAFCHKHTIGLQAWGPLGRGRLAKHSLLEKLGEKYNKTAAQIALRWITQHDCIPLPGSQNPDHIKDNFTIFDFTIDNEDMKKIDKQAANGTRETYAGLDEFDFAYEQCWPKRSS